MPVQFPCSWGKDYIFNLFVLTSWHASFSTFDLFKPEVGECFWSYCPDIPCPPVSYDAMCFSLLSGSCWTLSLLPCLFLTCIWDKRRNDCQGKWLGVDKSGSSKLSLYFLPSSFYNLCLESPEWEEFAQTLQHGCTPHFLPADLTYWFTVVILRCFEIHI